MIPQQRLYYEYVDNNLIPYWYVLTFEPCQLNWDKHVYYYDLFKPFQYIERDEFNEHIPSFSIYFSDFVFNNINYPEKAGLNLKSIKKRISRYGIDPQVIQQFVLSAPEISDLLMFLPKERKMKMLIEVS